MSAETPTPVRGGRSRAAGLAAIVFLAVFGVAGAFLKLLVDRQVEDEVRRATDLGSHSARLAEKHADRLVAATSAVAAVLRRSGRSASLDGEVLQGLPTLGTVMLLRDGRVEATYPPDAAEATAEMPVVPADPPGASWAGPARLPGGDLVFLAAQSLATGEARGGGAGSHVASALRVSELARISELDRLASLGFEYLMALVDPESGRRRIFLRSTEHELPDPVVVPIQVPGGAWEIHLAPRAGWPSWQSRRAHMALVIILAALAAWIAHELARQPDRLRQQVENRSEGLREAKRRLSDEIRQRNLAEARETWRDLDRFARLLVAASTQSPDARGTTEEYLVSAVRTTLRGLELPYRTVEIQAAMARLEERGILSRDRERNVRLEQATLFGLPEATKPLDELARETMDRIGAYRIKHRIGGGGMGEVFRAEHTESGQTAAVKLLYPHSLDALEQRQRFEREGSLVANLNHPNIVRLLDRGEHERRLFLVMEMVEGQTLEELLGEDGSLPATQALDLSAQIANALKTLHSIGVIHRDVKSSNVIRTPAGTAVLLDFGLASRMASRALTKSDTILGTVPYMAPERLRGERGTPGVDIFASGVLLYQMLVGRLPWKNLQDLRLVNEILDTRKVDLSAVVELGSDPRLVELLEQMLAYSPKDRLADGTVLVDRLFDLGAVGRVPTRPVQVEPTEWKIPDTVPTPRARDESPG